MKGNKHVVLPDLDGWRGNYDGIVLDAQRKHDIHELSWIQSALATVSPAIACFSSVGCPDRSVDFHQTISQRRSILTVPGNCPGSAGDLPLSTEHSRHHHSHACAANLDHRHLCRHVSAAF